MNSRAISEAFKDGIQLRMADWLNETNLDVNLIARSECKVSKCIHQNRLLDIYDCLQCKHFVEKSLSEQSIDQFLEIVEGMKRKTKLWGDLQHIAKRLQKIKRARQ